jgi:hypothetical protein
MEKINKEQFNTSLESLKKTRPSSSDSEILKTSILDALNGRVPAAPLIIPSPYSNTIRRPIFATVAGVLLLAGGLSYAANFTIPGDILYAIKTHINEPIILALKNDGRAKAEYQLELAKRRMAEMEKLYQQNGMDVQTNTEVASQLFNEHINAAIKLRSSNSFSPEERAALDLDIKNEQNSFLQNAKINVNMQASTSVDIKKDNPGTLPVKNTPATTTLPINSTEGSDTVSSSFHAEKEEPVVPLPASVQKLPGLR